jgi:predicted nucleic acid-binding protein
VADYLLDTNILILHLRAHPDVATILTQWGQEGSLCASVVSRTEILAGMHAHERERTMALLDSLTSLAIDEAIADLAGSLIYQYVRQGIRLSFPDALIAATALRHGLIVVTTNPQHFPMPDLRLQPFGA